MEFGEQAPPIIAEIVNKRGKATILNPVSTTKIGGVKDQEEKSLLQVRVKEHPVSLVLRPYDEDYITKWQAFREAGLPVIPTLRRTIIDNKPHVLITDVKADGSEVYGKSLKMTLSRNDPRERPPTPQVDEYFLNLTNDKNFKNIIAGAKKFANLATQQGIELPEDDAFELQVHPNGSWNLVILDLSLGKIRTKGDKTLDVFNESYTHDFLDRIIELRNLIRPVA